MARWTEERVGEWYREVSEIRGCNYLPRSAVNSTEMFQAETFDPDTMDEELGWAEGAGYNSIRVFLPYIVWHHDAEGFKQRVGRLLDIADRHGMRVMPIVFDDCAFAGKEPYLGPQADPVPGVHNSQWTPSPGHALVDDESAWPDLKRYAQDLATTFGHDSRVLVWDVYNEPGNSGAGRRSLPLVAAAFEWVREVEPSQPLTVGLYSDFKDDTARHWMELSDLISFHGYSDAGTTETRIRLCADAGRPVACTECVVRRGGNTFEGLLPLFASHHVGWYNWGLVKGRTQTHLHWTSKKGDPEPQIWQHDVFHPDGTPYIPAEIEMIRGFRFR